MRMSGDPTPPPGFNLVTSKKRSSKAAMMAMSVTAAESTAKSVAVRGMVGGQSPEKGKGKLSDMDPSSEGPSKPEEISLAVGRNGCHKCKSGHHCGLSMRSRSGSRPRSRPGKHWMEHRSRGRNSWKTLKTSGSCLIERKLNSLKRGEVVHEEQAESPGKSTSFGMYNECVDSVNFLVTFEREEIQLSEERRGC